ncbi:protocadherin2-gamma-c5-sCP2 [Triplophysa rosa]|uniref:Protocadherin2-gamma-c5-sCP2 n=1 Tax=Triplophysa rosa TaxID=992332 RepID=A0A9W7T9F6_TRIRA|nr:protocadherin2-gamma-c5-sCP2 [Triplophysa rosa]
MKHGRIGRWKEAALWLFYFCILWNTIGAQIRYTIPEELKEGSVIGNIAKDLGFDFSDINERKLQIASESNEQYFGLDSGKGELNGTIYSMSSFDYEKVKLLSVVVQAKDHGSPSFSSNATVHVFILDQNDNAPAVIYPSTSMASISHQRMPRSAKVGHLVTKVTAVDADSGHNAWPFYRLARATDASLFTVNLHTGEVRTKRSVLEQDDSSQRLSIEIKDNGEPIQSTTVTVDILIEDAFHEPISDHRKIRSEVDRKTGKITLYLIISLASRHYAVTRKPSIGRESAELCTNQVLDRTKGSTPSHCERRSMMRAKERGNTHGLWGG